MKWERREKGKNVKRKGNDKGEKMQVGRGGIKRESEDAEDGERGGGKKLRREREGKREKREIGGGRR